MITAELGDYLLWKDKLHRVDIIANGKMIGMRPIPCVPCPTCGEEPFFEVLEDSPLFQENAKPVETIKS